MLLRSLGYIISNFQWSQTSFKISLNQTDNISKTTYFSVLNSTVVEYFTLRCPCPIKGFTNIMVKLRNSSSIYLLYTCLNNRVMLHNTSCVMRCVYILFENTNDWHRKYVSFHILYLYTDCIQRAPFDTPRDSIRFAT